MLLLVTACTTYQPKNRGGASPWGSKSQVELSGPYHRVQRGETLSGIAERYGVPWRQVAVANGIDQPYTIYAGQALHIPERGGSIRRGTAARTFLIAAQDTGTPPGAEPARQRPAGPASTPTGAPVASDGIYVVRAGDTLHSIAGRVGLPMKELAALNDIRPPYRLLVGQKLNVPSAAPTPSPKPGSAYAATPALSGEGFLWPVSGKVIARFGQSDDGLRRDGINIAARKGAPVRAAEEGVVVYADEGIRGYGRMVLLRHADDYITTYAHNAALLVKVGDLIRRGQIIARVGDSGDVDQAQLHFEIRKGLKALDPERLLVQEATEVASSE